MESVSWNMQAILKRNKNWSNCTAFGVA